jgi:hypothetical protein
MDVLGERPTGSMLMLWAAVPLVGLLVVTVGALVMGAPGFALPRIKSALLRSFLIQTTIPQVCSMVLVTTVPALP